MKGLAVVVVGLVVAGCTQGPDARTAPANPGPPRGVPAFVLVHGKRVPYAGEVPWADALADPHDPRKLTVMADGQRMRGVFICVLPTERPIVRVTAAGASILVAGYGRPLAPGIDCGEPGRSPQPVTVTLPPTVNSRSVVDGTTGVRHPVLNPATVPTLGVPVPSGYVSEPISWDDRTGIVTRNWINNACATECLIGLRYAPPSSHAAFDQFASMHITGHPAIHGSPATTYTYRQRRGPLLLTETALVWTRPDHSRIVLAVGGGVRGNHVHVPTRSQALRFARCIR